MFYYSSSVFNFTGKFSCHMFIDAFISCFPFRHSLAFSMIKKMGLVMKDAVASVVTEVREKEHRSRCLYSLFLSPCQCELCDACSTYHIACGLVQSERKRVRVREREEEEAKEFAG